MAGVREFLNTAQGRIVTIALIGVALAAVVFSLFRAVGPSAAASASNTRTYIDATTGKAFSHTLRVGEAAPPIKAPSGGDTGYPAESCYWTADGKLKSEPTYVLLNQYKNVAGPTYCPDCGRLVTELNPMGLAGDSAPPKQAEVSPPK